MSDLATPWTTAHQSSLSFTKSQSLLKLMYIESVMLSNNLILGHPIHFSCLQSFSASGSFPISQHSASSGQSIGASASAPVLQMNIQSWFHLGLTGLIFLLSKGLSRGFSSTTVQKHQFFSAQHSLWSNSHNHTWLLTKNTSLTIQTCIISLMSLLFNTLSRFVIAFLSRSEHF